MSINKNTEKPQELLSLQNNAEENQNNSQSGEHLVERAKIQGTPFTVVCTRIPDEKHFITWGKYRISKECKSQEEALNTLIEDQWDIIVNCIGIMLVADKELEKEKIDNWPLEGKPELNEIDEMKAQFGK